MYGTLETEGNLGKCYKNEILKLHLRFFGFLQFFFLKEIES